MRDITERMKTGRSTVTHLPTIDLGAVAELCAGLLTLIGDGSTIRISASRHGQVMVVREVNVIPGETHDAP